MGATQGITSFDEGKFIKRRNAKRLDARREEYMNLFQKAHELNAKGKTEKATKVLAKADDIAGEYNNLAKEYGVYADLAATMPEQYVAQKRAPLNKTQKREIEDIEKGLDKVNKIISQYTQYQISQVNENKASGLSDKKEQELKLALKTKANLQADYNAKRAAYNMPTELDMLVAIYANNTPEKGAKLRETLKEQLKDANMYFGNTKELLESKDMKVIADIVAVDNEVNDTINKGYAGVGKKTAAALENVSLEDAARYYDGAFGADLTANRNGNERKKANDAFNFAKFEDKFFQDNQHKTFAELDGGKINIGGVDVNIADIQNVTLHSGEVVSAEGLNEIPLRMVRTVEAFGSQLDPQAVYFQKGDEQYISTKKTNRAAKAMGYPFEKPNLGRAVADGAGMAGVTGLAALLSKYEVIINDRFFLEMVSKGGNIESTIFTDMFKEIQEKLAANGGKVMPLTGEVEGFQYEKIFKLHKEHFCAAPAIAAAATTFVTSLVEQYMKNEEIVPEKAYNAARARLTLEMKHNAAGGDGYILNKNELTKALSDLDVSLAKILDTKTGSKQPETPVQQATVQQDAPVKEATMQAQDVPPTVEEAKYCVYQNKPGEYWDGIVRTAFVDAKTGKPIANETDIAILRKYIKQDLNGYKASDCGMPKGVKLPREYSINGRTYTYGCAEPASRITSNSLPEGKTAADVAFGSARVDLSEGTQDRTVTPGSYTYNWSSSYCGTNFEGATYTSKDERDAAMNNQKTSLEKEGYKVNVPKQEENTYNKKTIIVNGVPVKATGTVKVK